MSTKTTRIGQAALAVAVLGAGVVTTAGVASASTSSGGCSNTVTANSHNGAGRTLGNTNGGAQRINASNTCDMFNGNTVGSNNNTASGGSTIHNGNTNTSTRTSTTTRRTTTTRTGTDLDALFAAIFGA